MTEEELMRAVCQGNESAYQELVKLHLKPISHYAYRLLGNRKDTEDIAQEAFLRLWLNAEKWRPEKSRLSTWLHRIAHNLCVDFMRKHNQIELNDSVEDYGATGDIDTTMQEQQRQAMLAQALNELPDAQRQALALCHYQGFSNKEAADIMDLSVKALESALARAKRTLKTRMAEALRETGKQVNE